jgi:hypothetical protein
MTPSRRRFHHSVPGPCLMLLLGLRQALRRCGKASGQHRSAAGAVTPANDLGRCDTRCA